ncbi:Translocation and assembly module TamB [compost metagenome]
MVASGQLSDRLSLRYGVGVFEPANTIALRYILTKRLYLEAASGLASSLDLFFKRDF